MTWVVEILRRKPEDGGPLFGPFVGPASNKNDHQGYLVWGKGRADKLSHLRVPNV